MPPLRSREPHLDLRKVLDYLDQRTDADARRAVDEHLGRPCATCRELVRNVGELLETMRLDHAEEVPAALHERALREFRPASRTPAARRLVEAVARLVFDSLASPLPSPARRSVGEARRLRFQFDAHALDLELEPEGAETVCVRGRLETEDAALWTLEARCGEERFATRPDALGAFAFPALPAGVIELRLEGPAGTFRLPAIEP